MKMFLLALASAIGVYIGGVRLIEAILAPRLVAGPHEIPAHALWTGAGTIWILSIAASLFAFRTSLATHRQFPMAAMSSGAAFGLSLAGLNHVWFEAWTTVNGRQTWHFKSNWIFLSSLVVSVCALAFMLWTKGHASAGARQEGSGARI